MKSIVIYGTHYGTSKQYAKWIADELACQSASYKEVEVDDLTSYDNIIFGGGLYAGGVVGIDLFKKILEETKARKFLFTVGLADPKDEKITSVIKEKLNEQIGKNYWNDFELFFLRGGIDYSKLSFKHKAMMWFLVKIILRGKENQHGADNLIYDTYGKKISFLDRESLSDLLAKIREF